ncbi:MAG TPA: protein kinase [Pyrinomonadaceae bacterium]|nr:protein kinase [Pyrinomonadaceae bacterium]
MPFLVSPGTKFGHYEILSQLGAGGMGEVYLAQDITLDRKVALKILPADLAANADRMRRFIQEAKAAAALNHPNIAHVYEIGKAEGLHFIAMEFIDGSTLREIIHREQKSLPKLLRYLQHTAEGLAKAHAAGIVHRDLKPDNIMITKDDHAKILDFGLAKLIGQPLPEMLPDSGPSEVVTAVMPQHSIPGTVMGTVGYMSPEQAQAKTAEIDSRSDTFSFGCILFEAATGHRPFEADSVIKSLHKLVYEPAPPLSVFNPYAPAELQRIIRRCLEKDPEERYQTIRDVAIELKHLRREMDEDGDAPPARAETASQSSPPTGSGGSGQLTAGLGTHKGLTVVLLGLLVIAAGALLFVWWKQAATKVVVRHFQNMRITRVTNEGNVETAAVSPDGKYVAYSLEESGKRSVWTKHLGTGSRVQIVPPTEAYTMKASTFSSDGYVYYTVNDEANPQGALYQVPVLGGTPKKLISKVTQPISISPDGKQIAFGRYHLNGTEDELFVANIDGSNERRIIAVAEPDWLGGSNPEWSPDGKSLVVAYGSENKNELTGLNLGMTPVVISVTDGAFRPVAPSRWVYVGRVSWFNDGTGLVFTAQEQQLGAVQLWQISYPQGEARRITNDLNSYGLYSLTLTADDSNVIAVQSDLVSNVWLATVGQPGSEKQLTERNNVLEGSRGIAWTGDGRIAFDSNINGKASIWTVGVAGGEEKPLINKGTDDAAPEISTADGQIVFGSIRDGGNQVWRMDADGSNEKRLTYEAGGVPGFSVSRDGRWMVYNPFTGGIFKVSTEGGSPIKLVTKGSLCYPQLSPDGKTVAYFFKDEHSLRPQIGIIKFDDGTLVKTIDLPLTAFPGTYDILFYRGWHWSPDGRAVVYINTLGGVSNLWSQPLDGGSPGQITNFKSDRILTFAYSSDGRQLALARGSHTSDAVLITEAK